MRLFVSYARVDRPLCKQVVEDLSRGHEVWYDRDILAGEEWRKKITDRLNWCEGFVYLLSPESVASEYCIWEYNLARDAGKLIFPVKIQSNTIIPNDILRYQLVDSSNGWKRKPAVELLSGINNKINKTIPHIPHKKNYSIDNDHHDLPQIFRHQQRKRKVNKKINPITQFVITVIGSLLIILCMTLIFLFSRSILTAMGIVATPTIGITNIPEKPTATDTPTSTLSVNILPDGESSKSIIKHDSYIWDVAFSPDGLILASASADDKVIIWDLEAGKMLHILTDDTSDILSVEFSPDSKILSTASQDNKIVLWDVELGNPIQSFDGHSSEVWGVTFSPNGGLLASASSDDTAIIWDVTTGQELFVLDGHLSFLWSVAFSPDGMILAAASSDNQILLWDVETGYELSPLIGHTNTVWSVEFSPDGSTLASASLDDTVIIWDLETGNTIHILTEHTRDVKDVAYSPNGRILASSGDDNIIILWDVVTGEMIRTLAGHEDWIHSISFSPDGSLLASGSRDTTVILWDVSDLLTEFTED